MHRLAELKQQVKDGQIIIEFFFELSKIADVVNAFIESARELWGDGL